MNMNGHIDVIKRQPDEKSGLYYVFGWAANFSHLNQRQMIDIIIDGTIIGSASGNIYREDLFEKNIGDGFYGFYFPIPLIFSDSNSHILRAKFRETEVYFPEILYFVISPNKEIEFKNIQDLSIDGETPEGLVWSGKSFKLISVPRLDPSTWLGAIQMNVLEMPLAPMFKDSAWEQAEPITAVCALLMVKNEEDIISYNLAWLYYLGIRRFIILNNNSTDTTRLLIERFKNSRSDVELLIVEDPIIRYIQSEKTTGIMRLAASIWRDCSWAIPVDADEFIIAEKGLAGLIDVPESIDAIVVPKCYHALIKSDDLEKEFEANLFKRMPVRTELHRAPPKILLRMHNHLIISQGNHSVSTITGTADPVYSSGKQFGFYYREFSIRSFLQFKQKVIDGGKSIESAESLGINVGGTHWKSRYAGYKSYGDSWLRKEFGTKYMREISINVTLDEYKILPLIRDFLT